MLEKTGPMNLNGKMRILLLLCFSFLCLSSTWSYLIPFDDAPDEWAHFNFNVRPLVENHKLPISGVDDTVAFLAGKSNTFGKTTARYSYVSYPPLNYLLAAGTAIIATNLYPMPLEYAARMFSILCGCAFVGLTFLTLLRLTSSLRISVWLTLIGCFNPQIIFVSSYLNQDIYSLTIAAFVCYSIIRFYPNHTKTFRFSNQSLIIFSSSIGLLLTTKYNYFVFIPSLFGAFFWLVQTRKLDFRTSLKIVGGSCCGILFFAGYFFLRNFYLYSDILGQSFVRQQMLLHQGRLGVTQAFNFNTLIYFLNKGFFYETFKSFYAVFGYLSIQLNPITYAIFYTLLLSAFCSLIAIAFLYTKEKERYLLLALLFFCCLTFSLHLYNSLVWDYQSQGRYLFPIVSPTILLIAYLLNKNTKFTLPVLLYTIGFLPIFFESQIVMLTSYIHPTINSDIARLALPADLNRFNLNASGYEESEEGSPVEIELGKTYVQPFFANENGLTGITLYLAKNSTKSTALYEIRIIDRNSNIELAKAYIFPFELLPGNPINFVFKRIPDSNKKRLLLKITSVKLGNNPILTKNIMLNTIQAKNDEVEQLIVNDKKTSRSLIASMIYEP